VAGHFAAGKLVNGVWEPMGEFDLVHGATSGGRVRAVSAARP
jgi:hypothetical protein